MKRMSCLKNWGTDSLLQREMKIQLSNLKGYLGLKILACLDTSVSLTSLDALVAGNL